MNRKSDFFDKLVDAFRELEFIKEYIPPINKAGYPFIILFLIFTIIISFLSDFLGWIGLILTIWCVYFFRDPKRITPKYPNVLVAPADGKVLKISQALAPENLSDGKREDMNKISIFMNIFNVHVNRIPVSGRIVWLKYVPGAFFNASLDKSSEKNERMIAKIEIKKDLYIYVVQIAGLISRRIKCELEENQNVKIGERFGIIRFGSRVDLYLPKNFYISVLEDQTMISGETIVADIERSISKIQKK